MRYVSLFSGIEAATVAWAPLGWEPLAFAEVDPFCSALLAHYYPDTPNLGDVTGVDWSEYRGRAEILIGGPPCQAFSVAGLRQSLQDRRGNLSLEFVRAIHAVDPAYAVVENVPGWLSTRDNAFGCLLAGLVGADAPLVPGRGQRWTDAGMVTGPLRTAAWRVLDAQYFGLAQRRRRVFVVSCRAGDRQRNPAAVLFESEGVRRHTAPRREKGQGVARCLEAGSGSGGYRSDYETETLIAAPLGAHHCPRYDLDNDTYVVNGNSTPEVGDDLALPLRNNDGSGNRQAVVAFDWQAGGSGDESFRGKGRAYTVRKGDYTGALQETKRDAVAYTVHGEHSTAMQGNGIAQVAFETEVARNLDTTGGYANGQGGTIVQQDAIAYTTKLHNTKSNQSGKFYEDYSPGLQQNSPPPAVAQTLTANYANSAQSGGNNCQPVNVVQAGMVVRRLTPREAERLQGFEDDYTLIPYRGKPAADGNRYRALGNSFAVPVVRWIGQRIQVLEDMLQKEQTGE